MKRRTFLAGAVSLIAVPVLAKYSFAKPRIWGDGVHDDANGLQALLNGEPFVTDLPGIWQDGVVDGSVYLTGGIFKVGKTLYVRPNNVIIGCWSKQSCRP